MTTITKVIETMPTAPSRSQAPDVFIANADATLGAMNTFVSDVNTWSGQVNQVAAEVNNYTNSASTSANTATTKANEAAASAQSANGAAGAAKWVSGTTYAEGTVAWSPTNFLSYRRKVAGAGTTDPVNDTTNWVQIQTDYNNGINPTAIAQSINLTKATSGSNGIAVANDADINVGTGDFTLHWEGSLPDWTPDATQYLVYKYAAGFGFVLSILAGGTVRLQIGNGAGLPTYSSTAPNTFADGTYHKISISITRESVSTAGSVTIYADAVVLGASIPITAGTPVTCDTTTSIYILGADTLRSTGQAKFAILYNRALSAAEVLDLCRICRNGVAFADKGASQTAVYTSDFSAGVDGWSAQRSTGTGNIDAVSDGTTSKDDVYRNYASSVANSHKFYYNELFIPNKRYRVTFNYYIPSGQTNTNGVKLKITNSTEGNEQQLASFTTTGSWTTASLELTTSFDTTSLFLQHIKNGVVYLTAGADSPTDDLIYIRDMIIMPIGATLELTPECIQPAPGQWLDASGNGNHAMQPATGSSLMRPQRTGEVRWTNTWAGTHEAQFICGVNQAVLPSENIRIESITMRCSATGVNVTLGDNVNASRWVASVALATYLDATVANRNHDGTNRKIVIDPDAIFTGSITTTIKYIILD